jgi:hypothetical protein
MTWYIYLILLPLALGCASPLLASTTYSTTDEERTLSHWYTIYTDAGLHRAHAPEGPSVGVRCREHERDPWSQVLTRKMNASSSWPWSPRMSSLQACTGLTTVPGASS